MRKAYNPSLDLWKLWDEQTEKYIKRQDDKTDKEAKSFLKVKPTLSLFPPYRETKDQYDKRTKDWEKETKLYTIPYPKSFGTIEVGNKMSSEPRARSHNKITIVPKSKKSTGSRASTVRRRTTKRPEIEFKSAKIITSEDDKKVEDDTQLAFPCAPRVIQPITP